MAALKYQIFPKNQDQIKNFIDWTIQTHRFTPCELASNEIARIATNFGTMLYYRGAKGYSANCQLAQTLWEEFEGSKNHDKKPYFDYSPKKNNNLKQQLFLRDGNLCFYCHEPITYENATVEHLLSRSLGGNNRKENLCLACGPCNSRAGDKSIVEKIRLRENLAKQYKFHFGVNY